MCHDGFAVQALHHEVAEYNSYVVVMPIRKRQNVLYVDYFVNFGLPYYISLKFYVYQNLPWAGCKFRYHCTSKGYSIAEDNTILQLSYHHNVISYTGKTRSLYWIGPLCRYPTGQRRHVSCNYFWGRKTLVLGILPMTLLLWIQSY